MTTFIENLWASIFTPGPTSTLLIATNVSFGALQLVLTALLFATYSIHFLVLSVLSAGLWWSINWFAAEVSAVRAAEEEEKKREGAAGAKRAEGEDSRLREEDAIAGEKDAPSQTTIPGTPAPADALDDVSPAALTRPLSSGETGNGAKSATTIRPPPPAPYPSMAPIANAEQTTENERTPTKGTWNTSIAARLAPARSSEETMVRKRQTGKGRLAESVDSVSTDGEWEKVEEVEGEM